MNDIEALLEKYYAGNTSLEEERRIREYFAQHPGQDATPDAMLAAAVQATQQDETPIASPRRRKTSLRFLMACGTALAAGIALVITLRQSEPVVQQPVASQTTGISPALSSMILVSPDVSGEIQDELQALEQARKAPAYVSSKLNKGVSGINQFGKLEQSISKIQNKEKS